MDNKVSDAFLRLVGIMDELREKCPWDKKQTIHSLRQMTIEETYELTDAITETDWKGIKEELGDLLLHILFYTKIGSEQKQFELVDVINAISEKLITRHPHIYGDVKVNNEDDVKLNWEKLKLKEGKKSVLSGVPRSLPAMVKAMRLQEKAKQVGFEWDNKEQVWAKVEEESEELKSAVGSLQLAIDSRYLSGRQLAPDNYRDGNRQSLDSSEVTTGKDGHPSSAIDHPSSANGQQQLDALQSDVEDEFGDLMFSMINYARFLQVDAENALERTNKKFIHRFTQMEQQALGEGKNLADMSLEEMDAIWNSIKKQQRL